jgi:hypothetical protein
MSMMESRDWEFELVRYPNQSVQIGSFVAMNVYFDVSTKDIGHDFPLQVLREWLGLGFRRFTPSFLLLFEEFAFVIGFSECPGSVHSGIAVDIVGVFSTGMFDVSPIVGSDPASVSAVVDLEGGCYLNLVSFLRFRRFFSLTHLHRLGRVLSGPTGLDSEGLASDIPCASWED